MMRTNKQTNRRTHTACDKWSSCPWDGPFERGGRNCADTDVGRSVETEEEEGTVV